MTQRANVWLALSTQGKDEFVAYRDAQRDDTDYTGPMTNRIFKGLSKVADMDGTVRLFQSPSLGGKTYNLFSIYLDKDRGEDAQEFFDALEAEWPNHFMVVGAWWMDGRQVGTQWADAGDHSQGTTGTPLYPVHTQAYRMMPDVVEYDEDGNETSRVPPTSNSDLRDINLLSGQSPRRFT